jgi:hypothetical protein
MKNPTQHPYLNSVFPLFIVSKAIFGNSNNNNNVEKFVIYENDNTFSRLLGMGLTEGEALDNAERNIRESFNQGE